MYILTLLCSSILAENFVAYEQANPREPLVWKCDKPFLFGFGSWDEAPKAFAVRPDGIHIIAKNSQGGAGMFGPSFSFAGYSDWSPALTLTVGQSNKSGMLSLYLDDADGTSHAYKFDLRKLKPDVPARVVPDFAASIAEPQVVNKPGTTAGLDGVSGWAVVGDWGGGPVDVTLAGIVLVPPTDERRAELTKLRQLHAQEAGQARVEAEARQKTRQGLLTNGANHPQNGPEVKLVCTTGTDVLSIVLQAGKHTSNELKPYEARPGDEIVIEEKDKPWHDVKDGKVVDYFRRALFRTSGNNRTRVGLLSPDGKWVFIEHETKGELLDETLVDAPAAYTIQSTEDRAYATPKAPRAVFRKGKPNGFSQPLPFVYTISLQLPSPLKESASYTIRFLGVNTSNKAVAYVHKPRATRSLAVHAIQTGYRPDDPYKRAYLSFWMGVDQDGKHGSCSNTPGTFELLDAAGKTVFTGKMVPAKADGADEQICIHEKLGYTKAALYRLDFSAVDKPGEYRVFVPGIGVSGPFRINADVWEAPFKAAMRGILAQRQGIDLGPPACAFTRKRSFHPDDGVEFYQLTIPVQGGQEAGEGGQPGRGGNLIELAKSGRLERVGGVWGGYQDAGDWDTLSHHLSATYDLLGLYDLNRAAFVRTKLSLPAAEMKNNLPDILDEALWQMPCWRRLQLPDGGVRGGYGYGWGCPPGTTSSMIKSAGVYAADHVTTMHYAAVTARTARVLQAFDQKLAGEYLKSAQRAWVWAEAHAKADDAIYKKVYSYDKELPDHLRDKRAMAAVELLAATGNPDFDQAFQQSSELVGSGKSALYLDQLEADFAYARLPVKLGDLKLKRSAVEHITAYADHAIEFSRKNAFDIIAGTRTDYPLISVCRYFSTPAQGGFALIYAYELTKKPAYLAAAVQGANYSLGANPDNLSYCTGVGFSAQHFNFIVDAHITGQLPDVMVGHIPYGQGNEGNAMSRGGNGWVQTWLLNYGPTKKMIPNWYDWPVNEQYIDFARNPLHNENCFNQTTVPAACYWFYLATRA
jgi:endoglucanase